MFPLYFLGRMLNRRWATCASRPCTSRRLLAGSFVAVLLRPDTATVGASTAVFGLAGAAVVLPAAAGIDIMASGLGPILSSTSPSRSSRA